MDGDESGVMVTLSFEAEGDMKCTLVGLLSFVETGLISEEVHNVRILLCLRFSVYRCGLSAVGCSMLKPVSTMDDKSSQLNERLRPICLFIYSESSLVSMMT
jgi:hypothetical protein